MSSTGADRPPVSGQDEIATAVIVCESLSLAVCIFIIIVSAWIKSIPEARHHVQRVSYRIILWALATQSFYNIVRLCMYGSKAASAFWMQHPALCTSGVYFFLKGLHTLNFLITCIAINLMLIVCFGINPIEKKLERWYVGGSFALGILIPIVPAALGHFGRDPLYRICYLTPYEVEARLKVVVLDIVLWEIIACLVASGAILAVLIKLFRQGRYTAQALLHGCPINASLNDRSGCYSSGYRLWRAITSWQRRSSDSSGKDVESSSPASSDNHHLQDRFLSIALRISLYPIFLIIANAITIAADMYFNDHLRAGVRDYGTLAFLAVYQLLYAGRGCIFAILCICLDPSFRGGMKAAWRAKRQRRLSAPIESRRQYPIGDKVSFAQFLSDGPRDPGTVPTTPIIGSRRESELDISSALTTLPYTAPHSLPVLFEAAEGKSPHKRSTSQRYTKSFAGVASDSLPNGLSDDVDVDLRLSYVESPTRPTRTLPVTVDRVNLDLVMLDEEKQAGSGETTPSDEHTLGGFNGRETARRPSQPENMGLRNRGIWQDDQEAERRFGELNAQL